jgi:hypothetical protein
MTWEGLWAGFDWAGVAQLGQRSAQAKTIQHCPVPSLGLLKLFPAVAKNNRTEGSVRTGSATWRGSPWVSSLSFARTRAKTYRQAWLWTLGRSRQQTLRAASSGVTRARKSIHGARRTPRSSPTASVLREGFLGRPASVAQVADSPANAERRRVFSPLANPKFRVVTLTSAARAPIFCAPANVKQRARGPSTESSVWPP